VPVEVIALACAGDRLDAVKRYRELTNASVEEAKAIVRSI
jgi:ribosomal protein L7/L12